jgi:hypothetical protein
MRRRAVVIDCGEKMEEGNMKTTTMDIYIGVAGRREDNTRNGPAMMRRSLDVAGAPGRSSKIAGVGGRWRPTVGDDFK